MNDLDYAVKFIAELLNLFNILYEKRQDFFKPIRRGLGIIGDYMGSGYAFLDAFDHIYDEFIYNCSEELWSKIKIELLNLQTNKEK